MNIQKCFLKNMSRGTQIVYSANRTPVYVAPGSTVAVDLDENTIERIRDWSTGVLEIVSEATAKSPEASFHKEQDEVSGEEAGDGHTAQSLLEAYESKKLTYVKLVKLARPVLGDRMPDGVPKKAELVALLKESQ